MPTRDELKSDIAKAVDAQFPENVDLDADDLDTVEREVNAVLAEATDALDSANEDEDKDEEETT